MRSFFTPILLVIFSFIKAQDPAIQWQKTIGGNGLDVVYALEPTLDGGYILGGYSNSESSGEKTENSRGGVDAWLVKIDTNGTILWDKTIGGSGDDFLTSIKTTSDGGFIVGIGSNSPISGDKTENSRGGFDYWLLKLNASGSIEWQKTYGGAQDDFDTYIVPTPGGYFVSGYSDSNISGDKTVASKGQRDYWVLQLNTSGTIVWQKSIGGAGLDRLTINHPTQDGGFIMAGHSDSNQSGDKSENSRGLFDNWIVKIDAAGNIQWDKTYGGSDHDISRDVIQLENGNYLVGGYSHSGISGDKTEASRGGIDYWIYKLNPQGEMIWQKSYGGSQTDYLRTLREKSDGTILVTGYSNSNSSGDKTADSNGGYDMWFLLLQANGDLFGQNTIGGSGDESAGYALLLDDGYIFSVASASNQSGDKTEDSRGAEDYWIFKTNQQLLPLPQQAILPNRLFYPNPTTGWLTIDLGDYTQPYQIQISTPTGQLVYQKKGIQQSLYNFYWEAPSGIYFITLILENQPAITHKIIKI